MVSYSTFDHQKPNSVMKYKFTDETKEVDGHVLHRIVATCYFEVCHRQIKKGMLGGWIEKKENLQGEAWVSGEAIVCDDAVVTGNAYVYDHAQICDSATVDGNASIGGHALVGGVSTVSDDVVILHEAQVLNAHLYDQVHVVDKAVVSNDAELYDNVTVCDKAKVRSAKLFNYVVIKGDADIGSNLTILANTVLGCGVRITGYIGRDAVIKAKV